MRPHLQLLAPVVFSVVRDIVIPVKLAAEQAFLALFQVVNSGDTLFEVGQFFPFQYFYSFSFLFLFFLFLEIAYLSRQRGLWGQTSRDGHADSRTCICTYLQYPSPANPFPLPSTIFLLLQRSYLASTSTSFHLRSHIHIAYVPFTLPFSKKLKTCPSSFLLTIPNGGWLHHLPIIIYTSLHLRTGQGRKKYTNLFQFALNIEIQYNSRRPAETFYAGIL